MDAQGHVNNAIYLDYLQEARVDFLLCGPPVMAQLLRTGVLVVSHQVEYLRPIEFSERPLRIELWVDSVRVGRFSIAYDLWDGDTLVARARTGAVPFDLTSQSLRRLRPEERDHLAASLEPTEELRPLPRLRWSAAAVEQVFEFQVRWSDLDSYNHVNNVKYFDFVQEARINLLASVWRPGDEVWLLVRQDLEYLKPMDFRQQPYEVRTVVADIGTSSITLAAEITDPDRGQVYAAARSVLVCADRAGRPTPLDPAARHSLAQRLVISGD
nr:thioesterase family protein [Microlunatus panaciterrae]